MKIAIDLGHGAPPFDTGAIGYQKEEDLIRQVAPYLINELKRLGHEVLVIDIKKSSSVRDSLFRRCELANDWNADLFVSLHFNAFKANAARGCETFAGSEKGIEMAAKVQRQITGLGFADRGIKNGNHLYVLKYTDMPAILIEPAFCDSKLDMNLFDAVGAQALGIAIAGAF